MLCQTHLFWPRCRGTVGSTSPAAAPLLWWDPAAGDRWQLGPEPPAARWLRGKVPPNQPGSPSPTPALPGQQSPTGDLSWPVPTHRVFTQGAFSHLGLHLFHAQEMLRHERGHPPLTLPAQGCGTSGLMLSRAPGCIAPLLLLQCAAGSQALQDWKKI